MTNLSIELQPETGQKFIRIMERYSDKEDFFRDIIRYQVEELKNSIRNIDIDLRDFETKYRLSTEEFYQKFTKGDLGDSEDSEDFILWSGIYEMQLDNKKKLAEIE
jgi:hypothetical protein